MRTARVEIRPVFSYDIFASQRVGGISRYVCELHDALCRAGVRSTVIAPVHVCDLLSDSKRVLGIRVPHRLQIKGVTRAARAVDHLVEPGALTLAARREPGLILHRTNYSSLPPTPKYATAITVHDMIPERLPQMFSPRDPARRQKRVWCERADVIIAVSDNTKRELVSLLDVDPDRVVVCHHGVTRVEPDPATRDRLSKSPPFFLYVGNRGGYKNFTRLLTAFSQSRAASEGASLIAFGGGNQTRSERTLLHEHRLSHLVSFESGDDAKLAAHYASALCLLYPSLDEGFGMPPLEAMLHGCPVAASLAGAIPEVVGGAALLFEPTAVESISEAIDAIVSDASLRSSLASRGAMRAAKFSWDTAAKKTLAAYAMALEARS